MYILASGVPAWGRGFPKGDAVDNLCGTLPCIEGCLVPLCLALNVSSASTSNLLSVCVDFL